MTITRVFRTGWPVALVAGAALFTGAAAQEPRDSSRGPDPSEYSIAPEGSLPPPEPQNPELPDDPFGEPPEGSLRDPVRDPNAPDSPRKRGFHLEMDDN